MTISFPTPQASPAEDCSQEALLAVLCVAHGVKEELENKESLVGPGLLLCDGQIGSTLQDSAHIPSWNNFWGTA